MATYSKGFEGDPCPPGEHLAILVHIEDFGEETHEVYGKKNKVGLIFQTEITDEQDKRYLVRQKVNNLISPKSTLGKWLAKWRGKPFNKEELKKFNLDVLLNLTCSIETILSDDGQWANIFTIRAAPGKKLDYVVDERVTKWVEEDLIRRDRLEKERAEKAKSTADRAKDLDKSDVDEGAGGDDLPF